MRKGTRNRGKEWKTQAKGRKMGGWKRREGRKRWQLGRKGSGLNVSRTVMVKRKDTSKRLLGKGNSQSLVTVRIIRSYGMRE